MKKTFLALLTLSICSFGQGPVQYEDRCSRGDYDLTISSRRAANEYFDVYINGMYRGGKDVSKITRAFAKGDSVALDFGGKYWKYCSLSADLLTLNCDIKENVKLTGLRDFDSRYEQFVEFSRVKSSYIREVATKRTLYKLELTEASSGRTEKIEYDVTCR